MICFRGMTFCASTCGNRDCERRWTPELSALAQEWMGDDALVSYAFLRDTPSCPGWKETEE